MGVILCPLAVCGDTSEGRRFSGCSSSSVNSCGPVCPRVDPFAVVMWILMVGAGSAVVTCLRADIWLERGSVVVLVRALL